MAHGLTDDGLCWSPIARALEGEHEVVLLDARGHGGSAQPGSYSFPEHVADLIGVLEALAPPAPILLGHSMGGAHATAVAAERPDLVGALILEDPTWLEQSKAPEAERWLAEVTAHRRTPVERLVAEVRLHNPRWPKDELEPWAQAKHRLDPRVVTWIESPEILRWGEALARVRCPALLVTGDTEVLVTPRIAAQARELCATLEVAHLENAGHSIRRDQPAAFLAAVRNSLAHSPSQ
jgi:N-formylmaleamate deformylase